MTENECYGLMCGVQEIPIDGLTDGNTTRDKSADCISPYVRESIRPYKNTGMVRLAMEPQLAGHNTTRNILTVHEESWSKERRRAQLSVVVVVHAFIRLYFNSSFL